MTKKKTQTKKTCKYLTKAVQMPDGTRKYFRAEPRRSWMKRS